MSLVSDALKNQSSLISSSLMISYKYTTDKNSTDLCIQLTLLSRQVNTRNSSGDEIANVNFLYGDIVHALENTIDSCINSATDRFLQRRFTKFSEIMQCNGLYAVQGHSRSPILIPIESSYKTFLLVINTNLAPILHRFQVMADYLSNFR